MKGEANHRSKLVEADVLLILELYYTSDLSLQEVAVKFEVSKTQIWRIVTRRQWAHVVSAYGHEYTDA